MKIDKETAKTATYGFTFVSERGKPLEEWFRELGADGKTSRQTERLFVQERFAAKAVEE